MWGGNWVEIFPRAGGEGGDVEEVDGCVRGGGKEELVVEGVEG